MICTDMMFKGGHSVDEFSEKVASPKEVSDVEINI